MGSEMCIRDSGGIAGLAAAYELHTAKVAFDLHEASDHWGGKIGSSKVGNLTVDLGADSFLARSKAMKDLVAKLGLTPKLVSPISKQPPLVYREGELHELPKGTYLGVPLNDQVVQDASLIRRKKPKLTQAVDSADPTVCLLYTSPSPRDATLSRMPSSA